MLKVVGASWNQIRLSSFIIGAVFVLGIIAIIVTETGNVNEDGNYSATAYWTNELGYTVDFWGQGNVFEDLPKGVARAFYDPHIYDRGWAVFQVETDSSYSDEIQATAAGLLEGALTWQMIYWHWQNTIDSYCTDNREFCEQIRYYLRKNLAWAKDHANSQQNDTYWHQVHLFYVQLEGIEIGFKQGVKRSRQDVEEIESIDFLWMNIFGDLPDLEQKFSTNENHKWKTWLKKKQHKAVMEPRDFNCGYKRLPLQSALIKFVSLRDGLLLGHNSAGPYSHMLKVFKKYDFQYHLTPTEHSPLVTGTRMSFSSYPGAIHSMDDFYVISNPTGHNLVLAATPIIVYNNALWQNVNPTNQLLTGPRIAAANRLAVNPGTWSSIFSKYNSGTGNKEWMIVDMGLFNKLASERGAFEKIRPHNLKDLLWVLEQIPGTVIADDQTETLLSKTYWAGYGIPYYETIFEKSGTKNMLSHHGKTFSYNETALANIFRRDQANVTNLDSLMKVMRSNLYKLDPLSEGNPRCAIGSRGDVKSISPDPPEPEGVTDMKVLRSRSPLGPAFIVRNSTLRLEEDRPRLLIAAGPVYSENSTPNVLDDLSPFSWPDSIFSNSSHIGHPDLWTFQPINIDFI